MMRAAELTDVEFLRNVAQAGPRIMWFLGAGASRSSGLPTAADITWDLKRRLYCVEQNQDIQTHDVSNKAVRTRIQTYLESKGFPPLGDPSEYSTYFEATFGKDYAAQQTYLQDALSTQKISSTIGHRALAALLRLGKVQTVFTTNFDEVIETNYAALAGQNLTAFHLEGSYAALDALNADRFPLYAKVHGDFRYQSVKNLTKDLLSNDEQIQKCFVAAATRFGLVVAGYSGRDNNVMSMLRKAIDQNNAFPHGLYWTAPRIAEVAPIVHDLVRYAGSKGITSALVQTGTFDEMLSKIWRQTERKPADFDEMVRSAVAQSVSIALPAPGERYPMLRTNALLITQLPTECGTIDYDGDLDIGEIRSKLFEAKPDCTLSYTDRILFWGASTEVGKVLDANRIRNTTKFVFDDLTKSVDEFGVIKAMVEETICRALIHDKPMHLRKAGRAWYAVAKHHEATHSVFEPLRRALGYSGSLAEIHGEVRGLADVYWAEAASIRVEERNGSLRLLLRPDIWISPLKERDNAFDFLRFRKLKRYNTQAFELLSAWIQILLGKVGDGQPASVVAFPGSDYSAPFRISTRTAYSKRSAGNG